MKSYTYDMQRNFIKMRLVNFESWFLRFLFNLGTGIFFYTAMIEILARRGTPTVTSLSDHQWSNFIPVYSKNRLLALTESKQMAPFAEIALIYDMPVC